MYELQLVMVMSHSAGGIVFGFFQGEAYSYSDCVRKQLLHTDFVMHYRTASVHTAVSTRLCE